VSRDELAADIGARDAKAYVRRLGRLAPAIHPRGLRWGPDSVALMWLGPRWRRCRKGRSAPDCRHSRSRACAPKCGAKTGPKVKGGSARTPRSAAFRTLRWTGPKRRTGLPGGRTRTWGPTIRLLGRQAGRRAGWGATPYPARRHPGRIQAETLLMRNWGRAVRTRRLAAMERQSLF